MKNPFASFGLSAEEATDDLLRRMTVDRHSELETCLDAIESRGNVLLFGEKGIGKTFIARLIALELRGNDAIFPVRVDLAHLFGMNEEAVLAFPRTVLLQTCVAIWKELLEMPFLDLNKVTFQTTSIFDRKSPAAFLQEVYAQLLTETTGATSSRTNSVGASALFKGEVSEGWLQNRSRLPLQPFEFFEFAEVIQQHVLGPLGKSCLVAVCDEANLLPLVKQQDILERYLQLFLSKRIQFVFVAAHFPWESLPNVAVAFDTHLELVGWPDIECLRTIIEKIDPDIQFRVDAIEALWVAFSGHPRKSLLALHGAYELARRSASVIVTAATMQESVDRVNKQYQVFTRNWMALRPPT